MQTHTEVSARLGRAAAPVATGMRERIGSTLGALIAPAFGAISRLRRARTFHPRGLVFSGRCEAIIGGAFASLGAQLEGRVLARCSSALWKRWRGIDVLGIALRIRPRKGPPLDAKPALGDQDLLFATVRSPWLLLASPFLTKPRDFLANRFFATSPFAAHEHDRVELRLEPIDVERTADGNRDDRLRRAVEDGHAVFWLEARKTLTREWHAVARITLERELDIDQEALRFDPFRDGGGLTPVGLVHAMRRAVYAASQAARPH